MAEDLGSMIVRVGLDGANFNKGLKTINDQMKVARSELKATESQFDDLGGSIDGLKAKQQALSQIYDVQGKKVKELRKQYEDIVKAQGENSQAALKAAKNLNYEIAAYNKLGKEIDGVEEQAKNLSEELKQQNSILAKSQKTLKDFSDQAGQAGQSMRDMGASITAGVTAPLAALGALALKTADDIQKSQGKMQAALGLTNEEAKALTESAKEVYKDGWGESIGQITNDLAVLKQNLGTVDDKTLESAQILGQLSENADINSVSRALRSMTASFPGATQQKSLDLITKVLQTSGDASGDLLDTFNEYSGVVSSAGISMEDFANILINGTKAGARNYDVLADTLKEFNIRAKDGSKTTAEGFAAIGLNASEMGAAIAEGGEKGKEAFRKTLEALGKIEDPVKRNQAGVALFGTKFEDLEWQTIKALGSMENKLGDFEGSTEKAGKALQDNLGTRVQKQLRELGDALIPFGNVLMDIVEPALDSVSEKVEEFTGWLKGLSPEGQKTILAIAGMVAAIGPLLAGLGLAATGVSAVSGALALLSGPVGLSVAALAGLSAGMVALDKALDQPIAKSDIFKGKISAATEEAVGAYMKLHNEAEAELNLLAFSQGEITDEMATSLVSKYQQMGDMVLQQMKINHANQLAEQQALFDQSKILTEEEEQKRLLRLQEQQLAEIEQHNATEQRKLEIIRTANDENRVLTEAEIAELNELNRVGQEKAVEELSASQEEQLTILNNMKNQKGVLELEEMLNTVKKSEDTRDKVVKEAQNQYKDKIATIEEGRDVLGIYTAEEADAMIKEAERSRDGTVDAANRTHDEVVMAAYDRAGFNADQANWETNQVLTWQDKFAQGFTKASNWVRRLFDLEETPIPGSFVESGYMKQKRQSPELKAYADGTADGTHPGGLAIVSEEGPELIHEPGKGTYLSGSNGPELRYLRRGASVLPNRQTERLLKSYGFPGYADGIGDYFDTFLKGSDAAWDLLKEKFGLQSIADEIPEKLSKLIGDPLSNYGDMAKEWIKTTWDKWFGDLGSGAVGQAGAGVQQWAGIATQALMIENQYSKANLDRLLYQMQTESGGNPRAINLWDSNAKRGTPSMGLLQVIQPTYNRHKHPSYDKGPYDPLSNILASIRYAVSRYGSLTNAYRGVGYATGGVINSPQLAMLGENGYKEWVLTSEPRYRKNNLSMWMEAGEALGIPYVSSDHPTQNINNSSTRGDTIVNVYPQQANLNENGLMRVLQRMEVLYG